MKTSKLLLLVRIFALALLSVGCGAVTTPSNPNPSRCVGAYVPPPRMRCWHITSTQTWTAPADFSFGDVEACGGGGGGNYGGDGNLAAGVQAFGGSGGGGGVAGFRLLKRGLQFTPGAVYDATIGTAGALGTNSGKVTATSGGSTTLTPHAGGTVWRWYGGIFGAPGNSSTGAAAAATAAKGGSTIITGTPTGVTSGLAIWFNAGVGGTGGGGTPNAGGNILTSSYPYVPAWWGTISAYNFAANPVPGTSAALTGGGGGIGGVGGIDPYNATDANSIKLGGSGGNGAVNGGTAGNGTNGQGFSGSTNTCAGGAGGGGGGGAFGPTGTAGHGGDGGNGDTGDLMICGVTAYFVPPFFLPLIGLMRRRRENEPANDTRAMVTDLRSQWETRSVKSSTGSATRICAVSVSVVSRVSSKGRTHHGSQQPALRNRGRQAHRTLRG